MLIFGVYIIEDFQVIQAVLSGKRDRYAELVHAYHPMVFHLCLTLLLDRSEAEDAAQDVFVKAFKSLESYKRNVSFPAWLYRIASNHCLDLLRKRKRQKTESLDSLVEQKGDTVPAPPEGGHAGGLNLERREHLGWAMKVLATLSEDQRQILVLREVDGLHYDEISAVLSCSLDAVKARLRRARLELQEKARHFSNQSTFTK